MEKPLKRISLMIREDQYERLAKAGVNLSGLIRDLLDDYFGEHRVTLTVNPETHKLYSQIVSNTGSADTEIEPYLRSALQALLREKIIELQKLEKSAFLKPGRKDG
jgi:hypothetical protein